MSTRSFIFNPNESDELQSISNQPIGHQGSYINRKGTKATTTSNTAQGLRQGPVGLEGSYYVR